MSNDTLWFYTMVLHYIKDMLMLQSILLIDNQICNRKYLSRRPPSLFILYMLMLQSILLIDILCNRKYLSRRPPSLFILDTILL